MLAAWTALPAWSQCTTCAPKKDWTAMVGRYTHDAQGNRVDQYAKGIEPEVMERPDFERSGYHHYRSTLQVGNSADNMHVVESWGRPVRPYEEWRFPFRPYSVPYDAWGQQPPPVGIYPMGGGYLPNPYSVLPPGSPFTPSGPGSSGPGPSGPIPSGPGGMPPVGSGLPMPVPGYGYPYGPGGYGYPYGYPYGSAYPNPNAPWINGNWYEPRDRMMSDREFFNVPRPQ